MAEIDNLNFKVILDDKEFAQKVKDDIALAKELNTSLSTLLDMKRQIGKINQDDVVNNRKAKQMAVDNARAQERINREHLKTVGLKEKINAQVERINKGYQTQSRILNELKGYALGYLSVHGATQLLSSLVRVTGEFELQKTTLAAMLGDLNQAEQVITRIQGLAVESPFQFKELTTYAKQLSAFSVPAEELYDTTKMLADISAGLGVGMDRIVLAYGQVRSAAFLRGQEVRQFTEAGIPILDELAKQFTELEGRAVSTGEVFDRISARLVPFEMVAKIFKDMTSEGGKFYQMQEVQAETLRGKLSNLKDAYEVMLNEIGKGQSENLKGAVDWLRGLMQNYEETGKTIKELVVAYGAYRAALLVVSVAQNGMARNMVLLLNKTRALVTALASNPYAILAAGVTALGYALYKAAHEQDTFAKSLKIVDDTVEDLNKNFKVETCMLDYLFDRLEKLTVGTSEYNEVKSQILQEYGQYLTEVEREALEVGNLAVAYDKLRESIIEANRQKALSEGSSKLSQLFTTEYDSIFSRFDATIKALGIESKTIKKALADFVRGDIGLEDLPQEALDAVNEAKARINAAAYTGGGMFGSGVTFLGFDFEVLRKNLEDVDSVITEMRNDLSERLGIIYGPDMPSQGATKLVDGWRKTVQDVLKGMGLDRGTSFGLWAEDTTQSTEYVEDMIKRYKELGEQIKWVSTFDQDQADRLKKNKDAIEAIAKALNIDIENLAANKSDQKESVAERQLKSQIDLVKKLQDAYQKLDPYLTDNQLRSVLSNLFPEAKEEWLESFDFSEELSKLADELEKYDKEAAAKLRASIGKDTASVLASSLKAFEQYRDKLDEWQGEEFHFADEDEVGAIIRNMYKEYSRIEKRRKDMLDLLEKAEAGDVESLATLRIALGEEVWKKYMTEGRSAIEELANVEREVARKNAEDKAKEKASAMLKERLEEENIKLSDFGEKSIAQVRELLKRLGEVKDKIQTELKNLEEGGLTEDEKIRMGELLKELELLGVIISDTGDELEKKITKRLFKLAEEGAKAFSVLGREVSDFGAHIGDDMIESLGAQFEEIGGLADSLIDNIRILEDELQGVDLENTSFKDLSEGAKGGVMGIIVSAISFAYKSVKQVIFSMIDAQEELNEASRRYYDLMNDIRRESYSNIFGTDEMALAAENADILKEAQDRYNDSLEKFNKLKVQGFKEGFGRSGVRKQSLGDMMQEIADNQGWDLYLENGELNIAALEAYFDTYSQRLPRKQRKLIEQLIAEGKQVEDAASQQAQYLTDLFSGVADDIADSMVEAFIESGNAAIDMGKIMSNVSKQMVSNLIKSLFIKDTLDKYTEELGKITENSNLSLEEKTAAALAVLDQALGDIENLTPEIQAVLEKYLEYLRAGEEEDGGLSLGSGIKGITEDTANLLASYLNAIRADVSYSRVLWERMDANTQRIAAALEGFSAPSLMEYQAQIAANTFNTALATQSILAVLRGVIDIRGGVHRLRV